MCARVTILLYLCASSRVTDHRSFLPAFATPSAALPSRESAPPPPLPRASASFHDRPAPGKRVSWPTGRRRVARARTWFRPASAGEARASRACRSAGGGGAHRCMSSLRATLPVRAAPAAPPRLLARWRRPPAGAPPPSACRRSLGQVLHRTLRRVRPSVGLHVLFLLLLLLPLASRLRRRPRGEREGAARRAPLAGKHHARRPGLLGLCCARKEHGLAPLVVNARRLPRASLAASSGRRTALRPQEARAVVARTACASRRRGAWRPPASAPRARWRDSRAGAGRPPLPPTPWP